MERTSLLNFLRSLESDNAREQFAARCRNTSVAYLFQVAYGNRTPKADLCIAIERESDGLVACEELDPSADWSYLRQTFPRRRHDDRAKTA